MIHHVLMMETPSRPVINTFPLREGDCLHYGPECIFSSYYLARRWEFAIGSFSPWSRKQAGRHPPREEKTGSCSHRPARCEQVRFSSRGGGISCAPTYGPECIFLTYLARRWDIATGSFVRDPENKLDVILLLMRKTGSIRSYRLGANHLRFSSSGGCISIMGYWDRKF